MRAVVQRVGRAAVSVAGDIVGEIGPGLMILVCAMQDDDEARARQLAQKIARLRIFRDEEGRMNHSLRETGRAALVVSQFTLAADVSRGNRPGFSAAAAPEAGRRLYESFVAALCDEDVSVATGEFGADMEVSLVNDGPVTIWLDI